MMIETGPGQLHTLKTRINNKYINILVDPGSSHTIVNKNSQKKMNGSLKQIGKTILDLETAIGASTCSSNTVTVNIPLNENDDGYINIIGYTSDIESSLNGNEHDDNNEIWPNLDQNIKEEVLHNLVSDKTDIDIIIGQDNLWRIVTGKMIVHPFQNLGILKSKLGQSLAGNLSKEHNASWRLIDENKKEVETFTTNAAANQKIENELTKLSEKEAQNENEADMTLDELYATNTFINGIRKQED